MPVLDDGNSLVVGALPFITGPRAYRGMANHQCYDHIDRRFPVEFGRVAVCLGNASNHLLGSDFRNTFPDFGVRSCFPHVMRDLVEWKVRADGGLEHSNAVLSVLTAEVAVDQLVISAAGTDGRRAHVGNFVEVSHGHDVAPQQNSNMELRHSDAVHDAERLKARVGAVINKDNDVDVLERPHRGATGIRVVQHDDGRADAAISTKPLARREGICDVRVALLGVGAPEGR